MPVDEEAVNHLLGSWDGDVGRAMLERVAEFETTAAINAPIRPDHEGEHIATSITHATQEGSSLTVLVGNHPEESIRGYAQIVTDGSRPHEIRPRPPTKVLKFKIAGRTVYATKVNHPGTQADPYLWKWIHIITGESV